MKIATFNVNSVNARLPSLLQWLGEAKPDIVFLQEIKAEHGKFPFFELSAAGYEAQILGQKSYNGVGILSRHKLRDVAEGLPGFADEAARYIEATVSVEGEDIRVASVYVPNGNPPYNNPDDDSKYAYKLAFMEALNQRASELLKGNGSVVIGGDFNVILTERDVYNAKPYLNNALFREEVKQKLKALEYLGFYDCFRALHPADIGYTFWDYAAAAFERDNGMRIDYLLASPKMADRLASCAVDKRLRAAERPSDHTALVAEFR